MSQHVVGSNIHAASFFSTTPTTTNSTTFSPCVFIFPATASPSSISISRSSCPSSIPEAVPLNQEEEEDPVSFIHLQSICSEDHFDRVVAEAHQRNDAILVVWMASWCRKCIYLKPKLEKLAVDYYPRLQFYSVDVNAVSHKLVARAGVTKMPTIQLWKDGVKKAEVIGGHSHKAYLVINEIQEMVANECTM